MQTKLAIIIPAYNEGSVLEETVTSLRLSLKKLDISYDIVVVDDGSSDNTGAVAERVADVVLRHRRNCGLGATLTTGIEYARRHGYLQLVTYDADGQHSPADILKAVNLLRRGYDVVIGSRFLGTHEHMPKTRLLLLKLSNLATYLFFGIWTTDSQSGFRALSSKAISSINLRSNRMEVSSEFFGEIKRLSLKYTEFGIFVRYTPYSLSKGQKNSAGLNVLLKLLYLIGR